MGAVKEQSANLYATKMAEQGFVTLAMDLSSGEKVKVYQEIAYLLIFMQKISVQQLII